MRGAARECGLELVPEVGGFVPWRALSSPSHCGGGAAAHDGRRMNARFVPLHRPNFIPRASLGLLALVFSAGIMRAETSGPALTVATEAYNSDNQRLRDIHLQALSAEWSLRARGPLLQPFSLGALGSIYAADGESFPDESEPRMSRDASSFGLSAGVVARAYAIETERVALFTDLSASLAWFEPVFPPGGTPWNGVMRVGLGGRVRLGERASLVAGARWLHVSNGGDAARNPAYDALGGYAGFSCAWSGGRVGAARPPPVAETRPRSAGRLAGGLVTEFIPGGPGEVGTIDLRTVNGEFVYHPDAMPWLGLLGSMSLYSAHGERPDPNRGLGLLNDGSVGFGFNFGVRPTLRVGEWVSLFVEAQGGVLRTTRVWPLLADNGRFFEPWKWPFAVRLGAGVSWRWDERWSVMAGYRRLKIDSSDERASTIPGLPGDAPDFDAGGIFLGVQRAF